MGSSPRTISEFFRLYTELIHYYEKISTTKVANNYTNTIKNHRDFFPYLIVRIHPIVGAKLLSLTENEMSLHCLE